ALGTPHGLACALWLPTAWTLALGRSARTDASLAAVFDVPAAEGAARLRDWLQGLGIAATPAAFGITDAEARVQAALHSPRGRNFLGAQ
ncbi:MAG: alcohol dehydrogenase, partial [Burkholderiaceae bacterium]|nr:alcohol dehydrogenase [Burkholderiaceae bacterium]